MIASGNAIDTFLSDIRSYMQKNPPKPARGRGSGSSRGKRQPAGRTRDKRKASGGTPPNSTKTTSKQTRLNKADDDGSYIEEEETTLSETEESNHSDHHSDNTGTGGIT